MARPKYRNCKSACLTIMGLLLLSTMTMIEVPRAGAAPPVGAGDWEINTTEVYDGAVYPGGVITLQGNLTIKNNGNLTLMNGLRLEFDCSYTNEFHVEVQNGGVLQLQSGAIVTALNPANNYAFYVRKGGALRATNGAIIEEVGMNNGPIEEAGIYVNSRTVRFDGAEIRNNANGIVVDNVSPIIRNNDIHDNWVAGLIIYGKDATPTMTNNAIYNHISFVGYAVGVMVTEGADPTLTQNDISSNQWGIMIHYSNATIDDNTFTLNDFGGQGIAVFAVNEANIRVTNNTFDQNAVGVGASNFVTGVIEGNEFTNHPSGGAGVSMGEYSEVEVVDNYFQHNAMGIYIGQGCTPEIHGNVMEDNVFGMNLDSDSSNIHDNTIEGVDVPVNTNVGITLGRHSKATIMDNTIQNMEGGTGIQIEEYSDPVIEGNDITGIAGWGIWMQDFAMATITDNEITDVEGGIHVDYHSTAHITGGNITATDMDGIEVNQADVHVKDIVIDNSAAAAPVTSALRSWNGKVEMVGCDLTGKGVDVIVGDKARITLIDTAFDNNSVEFHYMQPRVGDMGSVLSVGWFLDVHAAWSNDVPIYNATVDIVTSQYEVADTLHTDMDGNVTHVPVIAYDRTYYDMWYNHTDHMVNVTKNGVKETEVVTMDMNRAVTVHLADIADPFIEIVHPSWGAYVPNNTFIMNGTANDPESGVVLIEVSCDAGANWTTVNTTDEWANWELAMNLTDGDHNVTARATNTAGGTNEAFVNFTVDTVVDLDITSPVQGLFTNMVSVQITGTAEPGLKLRINGANVTIVNGTFSVPFTLVEGQNTITFNATDLAGNHLLIDRLVVLDTEVPTISIGSPGGYSTSSNITISGTVSEAVDLTIDGTPLALDPVNMTFEHPVTNLTDGLHQYNLTATDPAGNTATFLLTVTVDTVMPNITVLSPVDGMYTNNNTTTVNGTTDADHMTIGGSNATIVNGTFSRDILLEEGTNTIEVVASDLAGNTVTIVLEVVLDTEAPYLTILLPMDGLVTGTTPVEVRGVTEPGTNVTANGAELTVDGTGQFSGMIAVTESTTTITVVARDKANNTATVVRHMIFDATDPVLTLDGPKNGSVVVGKYVKVKGVVSEADATVTINGKQVELGSSGNFSYKVELFEGKNIIVIRAVDKGGNMVEKRIEVTRERGVDLGWTIIALLFTLMGVVFGLAGGYAWGKFKATKERPRRKQVGGLEDQVRAIKGDKKEMPKEEPTTTPPPKPEKPQKFPKFGGGRFRAVGAEEQPTGPGTGPAPEPEPEPEPTPEPEKEGTKAGPPKPEPKPEPEPEPEVEELVEMEPEPKKEGPRTGPKPKEPKKEERPKEKIDDDLEDILSRLKI